MPIPTSTDVSIQLKTDPPAGADAVAVFVHKQTKAGGDAVRAMPEVVRPAVDALLSAGVVTGKSNEVVSHLLDSAGAGNGKGRRLLVIGLGAKDKFSAHCLL